MGNQLSAEARKNLARLMARTIPKIEAAEKRGKGA